MRRAGQPDGGRQRGGLCQGGRRDGGSGHRVLKAENNQKERPGGHCPPGPPTCRANYFARRFFTKCFPGFGAGAALPFTKSARSQEEGSYGLPAHPRPL